MAKRMFSSDIVESDAFMDMPLTAQALYMHLNMAADNDGFVNPKKIVRMTGAANDDMQILIAKRFVIIFDSGIVVIKHWWINNTMRHDRHVPTNYQKEFEELAIKPNKSYTKMTTQLPLGTDEILIPATQWQPNGNQRLPQYNAIQSNAIQSNDKSMHEKTGFKKTIKTKEQKRSYAIASQVDRDQEARVKSNHDKRGKGYDSFAKAGDILRNRGVKTDG